MGYTNYWKQPTNFTDQEWKAVRQEFNYVREIAGDKIDVEDAHDVIAFNGGTGGNCETFILFKEVSTEKKYPEQDLSFNFCKTRLKEYDIYVWHLLTFCQMIKTDFAAWRDAWSYEVKEKDAFDTIDHLEKKMLLNEQMENN